MSNQDAIADFRIVQHSPRQLSVFVVPTPRLAECERQRIRDVLCGLLGPVDVTIDLVKEIPRGRRENAAAFTARFRQRDCRRRCPTRLCPPKGQRQSLSLFAVGQCQERVAGGEVRVAFHPSRVLIDP